MNLIKSIYGDVFVKEKFLSISYSYNTSLENFEIKIELIDTKGFIRKVNRKETVLEYIDDIEA